MESTQPQADARSHIESIRLRYEDDSRRSVGSYLERALKILSEQLYQKSTHFLLELIQNADDNSYDVSTPTLSITYDNGGLRVDCNEIGFTAANVEAICGIGDSSKAGMSHMGRYIGERGIGFKSVFKAADVVWISSRGYSFKFDKNEPLGMIDPIWAEFPGDLIPGHTSFYLQLSDGYDKNELIQDICSTDSRALIFLRKLREINLTVVQADGETWKSTLGRIDEAKDCSHIITLQQDGTSLDYLISKHAVEVPKQPGCPQSEVLLAFPMTDHAQETEIACQQVYAFLPVRDHGFTFLLQGDFVLTANREDIDKSSTWNITLLNAAVDALTAAVTTLSSGLLRYSWLRYLPITPAEDFFSPLRRDIITRLAEQPILESCVGSMHIPPSLTYVPSKFTDDRGVPFSLGPHTESRYLSHHYSSRDWTAMSALGVKELSFTCFLEDLDSSITSDAHVFQQKPREWHSQLAEALYPGLGKREHLASLEKLRIIPLRGGEWVSAHGRTIFFSKNDSHLAIPEGVQVLVVDPAVEADFNRRSLFIRLGVKPYDVSKICRLILDLHADSSLASALSTTQLISHAEFLYSAAWQSLEGCELWFATENEEHRKGPTLYMDSELEPDSSATSLFIHERDKFPFLHSNYLLAFPHEKEKWLHWLRKNFGFSTLPRLAPCLLGSSSDLSDDFKYLFETYPSSRVLSLLRDNWGYYSKWIEEDRTKDANTESNQSRTSIRNGLACIEVKCSNDSSHPLGRTSLPDVDSAMGSTSHIAILDIPDPENQDWRVLESLGVAVKKDVRFYLLWLDSMQSLEVPMKEVLYVYEQIQARCADNELLLKEHFKDKCLIHIPPSKEQNLMCWVKAQDCVWRDPADPKATAEHPIGKVYPSCEMLFCQILGIRDEKIDVLVAEARTINMSSKLTYIVQLFVKINKSLKSPSSPETINSVQGLCSSKIFPTYMNGDGSRFDHLSSGDDGRDWFIADLPDMLESFRGIVPLLAFSVEEVGQMDCLFRALELETRNLSSLTEGKPEPRGSVLLHGPYSESLRAKAAFIFRLIPQSKQKTSRLYLQLRGVSVYEVTSVKKTWTLSRGGRLIEGRPSIGIVAIDVKDGGLYIFLTEENIMSASPPFELVELLSAFYRIERAKHTALLCSVLSRTSLKALQDLFQRQGILEAKNIFESRDEKDIPPVMRTPSRYAAGSGERPRIPWRTIITPTMKSPFTEFETEMASDRDHFPPGHFRSAKVLPLKAKKLDMSPSLRKVNKLAKDPHPPEPDKVAKDPSPPEPDKVAKHPSPLEPNKVVKHPSPLEPNKVAKHPSPLASDEVAKHLTLPKSSQWERSVPISSQWERSVPKSSQWERSVPISSQWGRSVPQGSQGDQGFPPETFQLKSEFGKPDDAVLRKAESDSDLFLAELITSKFLMKHIGRTYSPEKHWTSSLRNRAGYSPFTGNLDTSSSFTLSDCAEAVTDFLVRRGYKNAANWRGRPPVYHLVVAATAAEMQSIFSLNVAQFERARKYTLRRGSTTSPHNVLILVKVSNLHSDIDFRLYVDPWQLYLSNNLILRCGGFLEAEIVDAPSLVSSPKYSSSSLRLGRSLGLQPQNSTAVAGDSAVELDCSQSVQFDDNTRTRAYSYKQLGDAGNIRLLSLSPGDGNTVLRGVIHHTTLDRTEPYRAISYVWGSELNMHSLKTPQGLIHLTNSLYAALKRLREKQHSITLWVDAICINQKDNKEKAMQIRLMPQIFNSAVCVVAYLGDQASHSNLALETLMQIKANSTHSFWGGGYIPPANDRAWKAIVALFARVWFRRVWIIQEVVVAAKVEVICGDWTVDWNDLYNAVEISDREIKTSGDEFRFLDDKFAHFKTLATQREWWARDKRWALPHLLEFFRYAEATRQRDRLFALLGLAIDQDNTAFEPDYEAPFEDVVLRYSREFVRLGHTLSLLYCAGLGSKPARFPSWIPDWTTEKRGSLYDSLSRGVPAAPAADINVRVGFSPGVDDELVIESVLADDVASVSVAANVPDALARYLGEVAEAIKTLRRYPTSESLSDLKWRVPIANAKLPETLRSPLGLHESYRALTELLAMGYSPDSQIAHQEEDVDRSGDVARKAMETSKLQSLLIDCQNYVSALQGTLLGGRFLVTRRGYVGVGPNLAQVGDIVGAFGGGAVPFLLRKSQERDGAYRLVGECYIHGIADNMGIDYFYKAPKSKVRLH